jgi:NAD(P)-dependent dehydrogenase (short-subunit alcohol dehydrogenase family)
VTAGRLEGHSAIVTGGTEGIGLAVTRRFAAEGARVVVVARREGPGRALVDELGPERVRFVAGDVAEEGTAKLAVATALQEFERLDVLVNNAAMDFTADLLETSLEQFRQVVAIDLLGAFLILREAGRVMCEAGGGSIVNLTSRTAAVGVATMGAYSAAKAGLTALTRVAAIEWAAHGVRVNAVAPGPTETPLIRAWIEEQPDPSRFRQKVASSSPLGRLAQPEDVAGAVLYLASPEARHITGAVLPVDGGYTAQ